MNGLVVLDKPLDMGSNDALQRVKRLFQARKAGHTGSLDRLASGVLPMCLGEATKLSGFLLNADKRYEAVFKLGETTATGDAEGDVLERRAVRPYSMAEIERALDEFRGEIDQTPPMYSALKHQGQRLYKLAHQGLTVERKPRRVSIHTLELLARDHERLRVAVHCSKGTYIRTLAEDVGAALGCGAHVIELRRTAAGPFSTDDMVSLEVLENRARDGLDALDETLLAMDTALIDCPEVSLSSSVAYYLRRGQPVLVAHAPTEGLVRLYAEPRCFLGVGEVLDDGRIAPRRLVGSG